MCAKNILVLKLVIHSSFLVLHSLAARLKVLAEQYEVREEVCGFRQEFIILPLFIIIML